MTSQYRQSFVAALTGHTVLVVAVVVVSVLPDYLHPRPIDLPVDYLIVPVTSDHTLQRRMRETGIPPPPPPPDEPTEPRTPVMPDAPLPPPPPEKKPDKPPVKQPEKQPETPASKDLDGIKTDAGKKPDPHVKTTHTVSVERAHADHVPIQIGQRVERIVVASGGVRPRKPMTLSKGEVDTMFGVHAPLVLHDSAPSVPLDERQRCLLLIKRALYDAWDQPAVADAGSRPAELEVRFDLGGRVVSYRITQPSGSEVLDRSVLLAAKAVPHVEGLTTAFLKEYPKWTVEFKLSD